MLSTMHVFFGISAFILFFHSIHIGVTKAHAACRRPKSFLRIDADAACRRPVSFLRMMHHSIMAPGFCHSYRSKRVDDQTRFYANFRDFRRARMSTLIPQVLKPHADPVVVMSPSTAAHELQRLYCSALLVVVAEHEILLNHGHKIVHHEFVVLRFLLQLLLFPLLVLRLP